jgi:NADPH-dependent curcumin reductase CurA
VPVCGLVSGYNATGLPDGPDRLPLLMATILKKRIRMQGFIIGQDYGHRIHEFQEEMGRWVQEGKSTIANRSRTGWKTPRGADWPAGRTKLRQSRDSRRE